MQRDIKKYHEFDDTDIFLDVIKSLAARWHFYKFDLST